MNSQNHTFQSSASTSRNPIKLAGALLVAFGLTVTLPMNASAILPEHNHDRAYSDYTRAQVAKVKEGRVIIRVEDIPLDWVLKRVAEQSGIGFNSYKSLMNVKISADIDETSWTAAVRKLLEHFSKLEISNGSRLKTVWLMDDGDENIKSQQASRGLRRAGNASPEPRKLVSRRAAPPLKANNSKSLYSKLKRLNKLPSGELKSSSLFYDREMKDFFRATGVEKPEDLNDLKKVKIVKRIARRRIEAMEEIARVQN